MMPCLFSDGIARIDSNPDTSAFMRDRSQVPYAKILTKYDCTKLVPYAKVMTPDKVRRHEMRPNFLCAVSFQKSERPQDPSALEMKNSHGYRSGSTWRKIPYDTV